MFFIFYIDLVHLFIIFLSSFIHFFFISLGKWFNYGILFIVILLDLNMWKNQIFYFPYDYGQYIDVYGRIYTVEDSFSLMYANESILTFEYRNGTVNNATGKWYILGDTMMNARYNGYPMALKGLAFVPSIAIFLVFGIMIFIYGRRPRPTKENPYSGRLRKRQKKRFRARRRWYNLRSWFFRDEPALTRYEKKDQVQLEMVDGREEMKSLKQEDDEAKIVEKEFKVNNREDEIKNFKEDSEIGDETNTEL